VVLTGWHPKRLGPVNSAYRQYDAQDEASAKTNQGDQIWDTSQWSHGSPGLNQSKPLCRGTRDGRWAVNISVSMTAARSSSTNKSHSVYGKSSIFDMANLELTVTLLLNVILTLFTPVAALNNDIQPASIIKYAAILKL